MTKVLSVRVDENTYELIQALSGDDVTNFLRGAIESALEMPLAKLGQRFNDLQIKMSELYTTSDILTKGLDGFSGENDILRNAYAQCQKDIERCEDELQLIRYQMDKVKEIETL